MRKVIITLCYNRPEVVAQSIGRLKRTQDTNGYEKYLIDVSYPLPDVRQNTRKLANLAHFHGYDLIKPYRNRGVAVNWMHAAAELELQPGDVLIGMDPDSEPTTPNWCDALVNVLSSDPTIAYCGLTRISKPTLATEVDESQYRYKVADIGGEDVRFYDQPVSWPMGAFSVKFMKEIGIHQPRTYYGFIEIGCMKRMANTDWRWCMLDKHFDKTSDRGEESYKQWKIAQAKQLTDLDFKDYLLKQQAEE